MAREELSAKDPMARGRQLLRKVAVTTAVALVGLAAGFALGALVLQQPTIDSLSADLAEAQAKVSEQQVQVDELLLKVEDLIEQRDRLQTALSRAEEERDRKAQEIEEIEQAYIELREGVGEVDDLRQDVERLESVVRQWRALESRLEADRLLLVELRKEFPPTRRDAEAYLERLQRLALISEPRLGPIVAEVMNTAPILFDWLDQEFDTYEQQQMAYVANGADHFYPALRDLRSAILLTVANRLETLRDLGER